MDMKAAFLKGELEEEIAIWNNLNVLWFMDKKTRYKSLYSLKHAHMEWHDKIDNIMVSNDYKANKYNIKLINIINGLHAFNSVGMNT